MTRQEREINALQKELHEAQTQSDVDRQIHLKEALKQVQEDPEGYFAEIDKDE